MAVMEQVECVVVGAGVVGLAIARICKALASFSLFNFDLIVVFGAMGDQLPTVGVPEQSDGIFIDVRVVKTSIDFTD